MIHVFIGPHFTGKNVALEHAVPPPHQIEDWRRRLPKLGLMCPEVYMHPADVLKLGHELCLEGRKSENLIYIVTHSPELLGGALTEGWVDGYVDVEVFDRHGERKLLSRTDEWILEWLEVGWDLGDLYRVGHPAIGGWPW